MNGSGLPPLDIPGILRKHDIRPSKGLGQNFLVSNKYLQKIVSAANIKPTDAILEIGPGLGSLTRYLALAGKSVTAVELDRKLIPLLEDILSPYKNVNLIQGDILHFDPADILEGNEYTVVANIPYYITSNVIRHLLESTLRPRKMILTVQKEVAERICALPGDMSILAISVQVFGNPRIIDQIPASAFFPSPKVDSSVLYIEIHTDRRFTFSQLDTFFTLVKAGFSQKRKTLRNSLSARLGMPAENVEKLLIDCSIDPQRRAETLSLNEWEKLTTTLSNQKSI